MQYRFNSFLRCALTVSELPLMPDRDRHKYNSPDLRSRCIWLSECKYAIPLAASKAKELFFRKSRFGKSWRTRERQPSSRSSITYKCVRMCGRECVFQRHGKKDNENDIKYDSTIMVLSFLGLFHYYHDEYYQHGPDYKRTKNKEPSLIVPPPNKVTMFGCLTDRKSINSAEKSSKAVE